MDDLKEKQVMVITGARQGIGRYLAEYYVEKGYEVIGCGRQKSDFQSDRYQHFCLNVSDEESVTGLFYEIRKKYERLDILINNAGIAPMNFVMMTPLKSVQETLQTNVIGTFLFCREAAKMMKRRRKGRIVNLSSIHVPLSTMGSAIYGGSKAFIEQFSRVLARELASDGIRVNTLGLSFVKNTGMTNRLGRKIIDAVLEKTVLKRQLEPGEVAEAINTFLTSDLDTTAEPTYLGGISLTAI